MQKANPDYGQQSINPISRLIQIQQAKKEKDPVYALVAEKGVPRRREFIMQVGTVSSPPLGQPVVERTLKSKFSPKPCWELDGERMVTPTAFRCGHVTKGCSTLVHQGAEMSLENVPATIRIQLTRPYLFDGGLSMRRWMRSDGKWNM